MTRLATEDYVTDGESTSRIATQDFVAVEFGLVPPNNALLATEPYVDALRPSLPYKDVILAHPALLSFYGMDESSGDLIDAQGGVDLALAGGSITRGVPSLVAGGDGAAQLGGGCFGISSGALPAAYMLDGTKPFTLELWEKFVSLPSSGVFSTNGPLHILRGNGSNLGAKIGANLATTFTQRRCWSANRGDGFTNLDAADNTIALNTLYHMVATYDGTDLRLYRNNALLAGPVASGSVPAVAGDAAVQIGVDFNATAIIDDVAIYSVALDAATIQEHYELGMGI